MVIKCRPARCLVIKQWAGAPGQAGQQRPGLSCLAWSGEKKWTFNYVLITSPSHLQGPPPTPRGEHSNKKKTFRSAFSHLKMTVETLFHVENL